MFYLLILLLILCRSFKNVISIFFQAFQVLLQFVLLIVKSVFQFSFPLD